MKQYPIKDGHRTHYVRYPIEVTESTKPKKSLIPFELGKWVAVDVLKDGYSHLIAPVMCDTEEECQKGCDAHNTYIGLRQKEVEIIISKSMESAIV